MKLALLLSGVAASALLGTRFTPTRGTEIGDWYRSLNKSPLTPPDGVFGPVWTTLYALMAIAGYRIWSRCDRSSERTRALALWPAQLALNAAWSPIFFGAKRPDIAMLDLVALWIALVLFVRDASKVDKPAAAMFAPYVAWVTFAGVLNAEIIRRN
jgi:translocator protein